MNLKLEQVYELRGEGAIRENRDNEYPTKVPVDTYTGTFKFGNGVYVLEFEMQLALDDDEIAIVQPTDELEEIGCVMPPKIITETTTSISCTVNVFQTIKIDHRAEIAEVYIG